MYRLILTAVSLLPVLLAGCATHPTSSAGDPILMKEHYVTMRSAVPGVPQDTTRIYVRERTKGSTIAAGSAAPDRVVLFVHGAGTPADVAFDVPRESYSWMSYLAASGFDVFSMDHTGYGRSTRPSGMENPCNVAPKQQAGLGTAKCKPSQPGPLSNIAYEWDEINAVVDYLRRLRNVDQVHLIAWSRGGPRAGGFAARYPDKVHRMVLLAPAYLRTMPSTAAAMSSTPALMNTQSREEFIANWDRQVGCAGQYESATADSIWSAMIESDPVGAKWGKGVRRAPDIAVWGWNPQVVSAMRTPTLMVIGTHDKQVIPERVRHLYTDLGSANKVYVEMGCSSHNAMWEKNREILYKASLEWLTAGSVEGVQNGMLYLGH